MEEIVTYCGDNAADKSGNSSLAYSVSLHSNSVSYAYKGANASRNGVACTGFCDPENSDKLFVAVRNKALIHVYSHGRETAVQKIPVPEQLTVLALSQTSPDSKPGSWLLVGGGISGKLFVWDVNSGNLLFSSSVHYQRINKIAFCGSNSMLVTCSDDSRVLVFRVADLVSFGNIGKQVKPVLAIVDHSLPVNDFVITSGTSNDLQLVTVSSDSTCRVYDLSTFKQKYSLVLSNSIHSVAIDPVFRSLYLGLDDGTIRQVQMYKINKSSKKLHHIAETTNIITLEDDPEFKETFNLHENQDSEPVKITALAVSFDGTVLVSGDSKGKVLVSDILTRQTMKTLKSVAGPVSYLNTFVSLSTQDTNKLLGTKKVNVSPITPLKRFLADSTDLEKHTLVMEVPENAVSRKMASDQLNGHFDEYLDKLAQREKKFSSLSGHSVSTGGSKNSSEDTGKVKELEEKLQKITSAYADLRQIHEELYEEHAKLMSGK